ncbi:MAG: GntR family transcriptional regulator [Elainellaceae cyanobacterium]
MTAKLQLTSMAGLSRTTQASVTEYLRQAILSGELPAGTRLVQSELAEVLNVSVTPIREALRELSTQGLIDLDAFRGAVVHTPTLTELEEIFEVRTVLLPFSIRKGVEQITSQELDQAEAILAQMEAETQQTRWIELNRQFHGLLYRANSNSKLRDILQQLSDIAAIYINLSFAQTPLQQESADREHRMILNAYRQKDVEQAIAITLNHINSTLEAARKALQ